MPQLWFIYALGAAILWGYSYALSDKVMRADISPLFLMVVTGALYFIFSIIIALAAGQLKGGFVTIFSDKKLFIELMVLAICYVAGSFLIYVAISLKNATAVNLIEISFPIFTLIFAYFMLKEIQVNMAMVIGGLMIFGGIGVIYLKG
jgi:drug/metabolite transporter (DMT)-like permease